MLLDSLSIPILVMRFECGFVIDAQQRGGNRQTEKRFCKLGRLSCLFELFQTVYRLKTAPSHAGGGLGPPWAACGTQPSWAHTTHAFTTALYWKMAQTLGVFWGDVKQEINACAALHLLHPPPPSPHHHYS